MWTSGRPVGTQSGRVKRHGLGILLVLVGCSLAPAARGGDIWLRWAGSHGATGYRVLYGKDPGQYTFSRDVRNTLGAQFSGLDDCTDWYFVI